MVRTWGLFAALLLSLPCFAEETGKGSVAVSLGNKSCLNLLARRNPNAVTIGHLNVENTFDFKDDLTKVDEEYLPYALRPVDPEAKKKKIDWTREKLKVKFAQIDKIVAEMGYPDILSLVEVENYQVVAWLAQYLGYNGFLVTESPDGRGIDCAILYRDSVGLEMVAHGRAVLDSQEFAQYPTRHILEAVFRINENDYLIVHGNHWPSQRGPAQARFRAAEILHGRQVELARRYPGARFLATGDFNVIDEDSESPHAFKDLLLNPKEQHHLVDLEEKFRNSRSIAAVRKKALPDGTYFYDRTESWNRLDRFLLSPNAFGKTGIRVDLKSFRVINPPWASTKYTLKSGKEIQVPLGYDHHADNEAAAGFQDHYGISFTLETK